MNSNVDAQEINKFNQLANEWWNINGKLKTLHDINPARVEFIMQHVSLQQKNVLDIGCGGGILCEAMAEKGANVTGIDMEFQAIQVARDHQQLKNLEIQYEQITAEELALQTPPLFDVVTCLEMLEHVPEPDSIIKAASQLVTPNGILIFSTINRTPKAYGLAVLGAEYLLNLIPKGTHDYKKFIQPAELAKLCRENGLTVCDMKGLHYNPITRQSNITDDVTVNYLLVAKPIPN